MSKAIATSLLDQLVSAYVRRYNYRSDDAQRSEYHLATGFVRAISFDDKGYLTLMVETVYSDGYELGEKPQGGDIITLSSNVDGTFRLSRTEHPFAATQAPGFPQPAPPAPPPSPPVCDHAIVDQSLHLIPVRLHATVGEERYMTVKWCGRCGSIWQGFGDTSAIADTTGEWTPPGGEPAPRVTPEQLEAWVQRWNEPGRGFRIDDADSRWRYLVTILDDMGIRLP